MTLGGPGYRLVEKARDSIVQHRMVSPGDTIVAALSGGPDSTCLLDVLDRLTPSFELNLEVAHVDHGLADDSDDVAASVTSRAAKAGYEVHFIKAPDLAGANLQARARDFRYGFLEAIAANVEADHIATGHTLDDRAETTLARLLHGAGTRGLAGLLPVDGLRIRPLIAIRRAETRDYCVERGLEFHEDPANEDDRFERAAVRKRIVAAIEQRWGGGAVEAIAVSAGRLAEDADALEGLASAVYEQLAKRTESEIRFEREAFMLTPKAFRRRLLEMAMGRVRDRSGGIDEALEALDRDPSFTGRFSAVGGAEIAITSEHISVVAPPTDSVAPPTDSTEPGTTLSE